MKDVLIVIDMQKDFVTGALGSEAAQAVVEPINTLIKEYESAGKKIIFTRDTHSDRMYQRSLEGSIIPNHCFYGSDGWRFADELYVPDSAIKITKPTFGSLDLNNQLNHKETIEICGVCTDICVVSNALILRAQRPNCEIAVNSKCCAGTSLESHNAALDVMKSCLIEIV